MEEAENIYYEASKKPINEKELNKLEKNLVESQKLLSRFKKSSICFSLKPNLLRTSTNSF
jgi:hypothetical protein